MHVNLHKRIQQLGVGRILYARDNILESCHLLKSSTAFTASSPTAVTYTRVRVPTLSVSLIAAIDAGAACSVKATQPHMPAFLTTLCRYYLPNTMDFSISRNSICHHFLQAYVSTSYQARIPRCAAFPRHHNPHDPDIPQPHSHLQPRRELFQAISAGNSHCHRDPHNRGRTLHRATQQSSHTAIKTHTAALTCHENAPIATESHEGCPA